MIISFAERNVILFLASEIKYTFYLALVFWWGPDYKTYSHNLLSFCSFERAFLPSDHIVYPVHLLLENHFVYR